MSTHDLDWTPGCPNDRSVFGFRVRHGTRKGPMSKSKYFSMKRAGKGPQELVTGGMVLITAAAEAEWERRCMAPTGAAARLAKREAEARKKKSKAAATRATASPRHVSKQRKAARAL